MIGIIGNGSWATALAKMLTYNEHPIHWWMRSEQAIEHLLATGHNPQYLTSVQFNAALLQPTNVLETVVAECNTLIICVPSAYIMKVLDQLEAHSLNNKVVVSAIKGILPEHHVLLNDYLVHHKGLDIQKYNAITGPCHAEEVAQERLSYLTFSGLDKEVTLHTAQLFATPFIRTTTNNDLWGAQYAAVLKNIYAVGAGIAHGLGYGDNFLSVYITNCYREMYDFLEAEFNSKQIQSEHPDFHTSAYLGDLLVTCYSPHSRNRSFGNLIGKGYSVRAATAEMSMVAEGYYAVKGMDKIIAGSNMKMPIMRQVHNILWQGQLPASAFKNLEPLLS